MLIGYSKQYFILMWFFIQIYKKCKIFKDSKVFAFVWYIESSFFMHMCIYKL